MTASPQIFPERFTAPLGDGALAGWRWKNAGKPPLLFCHATGFCASAYKQMLAMLSDGFDIYALDMRGHGRTTLPSDPGRLRSWRIYAKDIGAFLDSERREGWVLAGHSMGGVTAAMAARSRNDVACLKLIEPVAMPRRLTLLAATPIWPLLRGRMSLVSKAAGRRAIWSARSEVVASYGRKGLFKSWSAGALSDYLEDGLTETDDGVRLSCAPRWEAATFAAQANDFWGAVKDVAVPVEVYVADSLTSTVSLAAREKLRRFGAQLRVAAGVSHLAPMEKPAEVADFVAQAPCSS
jgi:pimeloyl-ACP methyl ester carboxylesterase